MKESDLLISHRDGVYFVKVSGRANFEYAVPLRELAKTLEEFHCVRMDMTECLAMDSTFMGVLSMIGLAAKRSNAEVELVNASDFLTKLLRDLGVVKLFTFVKSDEKSGESYECVGCKSDLLTTAETVAEAHETLIEADKANAGKFDAVVALSKRDVERLKKERDDQSE
ncbi:MAG: STAS domain-containing protein [Victivallales bacterium]|jgi:ABC-type transporter Mla MlaB component|nr:STAS domain-containing protein [Victivallales bacterium]